MKNGKFSRKSRYFHIRYIAVLVSVALICVAATGATLAYLTATDDAVRNAFTPSQVTSLVVEEGFDKITKTNVKIQNTGDVSAYIRADIVVTWMDENGNVLSYVPEEGKDYTIALNVGEGNWFTDGDYYYWPNVVEANGVTDALISSATANYKNGDYYVSIEILSSAIQSVPDEAVESAWPAVKVSGGKLVKAN